MQYFENPSHQAKESDFEFLQLSLWEISSVVKAPCSTDTDFSGQSFALPTGERPQDRLFNRGVKALSMLELLAILFSQNEKTSHTALRLSYRVLQELQQGDADILERLRHITLPELIQFPGIDARKAAIVVAAIELGKRLFFPTPKVGTFIDDPAVAAAVFAPDLMWEVEERFSVLFLNVKHRFLSKALLTIGNQTSTIASPREIFGEALRRYATRIIVAHNHPSGDLSPSQEDISLTKDLLIAGRSLNLPVLDHLILGGGSFLSLRQTTDLWSEVSQEESL